MRQTLNRSLLERLRVARGLRVALVSALVGVGCASANNSAPIDPGREARRHRAALATIIVDNRTGLVLAIAFRPAIGPGGEVVIGKVAGHTSLAVAPIPAGEPIVLLARENSGLQLELAPRSFAIDTTWTWVVPADAHFEPRAAAGS
jgi:hypothetical protein